MSGSRNPTRREPRYLGLTGESEWTRLHAQLKLTGGFWLGFLFTASPVSSRDLADRTAEFLRFRARSMLLLRPEIPRDLTAVVRTLLDGEADEQGCVWVSAVRTDSSEGDAGPWTRAWDDLLLRLNERRDALRRRLSGGLVLAAHTAVRARVRAAAPDLWSVRSLVLDLEATPELVDRAQRVAERTHGRDAVAREADPDGLALALAEATRAEQSGKQGATRALADASNRLREQGKPPEARDWALRAMEAVQREQDPDDRLRATALVALVRAAHEDGDPVSAYQYAGQALGPNAFPDPRERSMWLDLQGAVARDLARFSEARDAFEEALELSRRILQSYGDSPQALHDLSVTLNNVGTVRRELGELAEALDAFEESLELGRRILQSYGENPQALRNLSVTLDKVGEVLREQGELARARDAFVEALELRRRILQSYGESPQALRDLSVSLNRVGDVRRELGEPTEGGDAIEDST